MSEIEKLKTENEYLKIALKGLLKFAEKMPIVKFSEEDEINYFNAKKVINSK